MHRLILNSIGIVVLMMAMACGEVSVNEKEAEEWTMTWEIDGNTLSGTLILFQDKNARLLIDEVTNTLLVDDSQDVRYTWSLDENYFKLRRVDNGISLDYRIKQAGDNYYEMTYADEMNVKLIRQSIK